MNVPYHGSIDSTIDRHKKMIGKKCTICGHKYEEHSYIMKLCPDYDPNHIKNWIIEEESGRWLDKKFVLEVPECDLCIHFSELPYNIFNKEVFICKKRKIIKEFFEKKLVRNFTCSDFKRNK
jgi:hypothetical protein